MARAPLLLLARLPARPARHLPGLVSLLPLLLLTIAAIPSAAGSLSATWVRMSPLLGDDTPSPPSGRCDAGLLDLRGDTWNGHAVMIGGSDGDKPLHELWSLDVDGDETAARMPTATWESRSPSGVGDAPAARVGMSLAYLPDFRFALMFGGRTSDGVTDDVWALDVTTYTWRRVASAGTPSDNSAPFARAGAVWARTSDHPHRNEKGDLTYTLLMYGGTGDAMANVSSASGGSVASSGDRSLAQLWRFDFSASSTDANEFYASWQMMEAPVCTKMVCTDEKIIAEQYPEMHDSLSSLSSVLAPNVFSPSSVPDLLSRLSNVSSALSARVADALQQFENLPTEEQMDDPESCTGCVAWEAQAVVTGGSPHPPTVEGHRLSAYEGTLRMFGGYSCTANGMSLRGGASCYSSDVWTLTLSTPPSWSVAQRPANQSIPWPHARAFHAQAVYGNRLFVYGGVYHSADGAVPQPMEDGLWALDIVNGVWEQVITRGSAPPLSSSAGGRTSSLLVSSHAAYIYSGCDATAPSSSSSSSLYMLRFDSVAQPSQCYLSGPGIESPSRAGEANWILLHMRRSVAPGSNDTEAMEWAEGLHFVVELLNEHRGLVRASVQELGKGVYNASYTLVQGHSFRLSVLLHGTLDIRQSPFQLLSLPQPPSARFVSLLTPSATIKGEVAFLLVSLRDEFGNPVLKGGDVQGAVDVYGNALVDAGENRFAIRLLAGSSLHLEGQLPEHLRVFSPEEEASSPDSNALLSVLDQGNGSYTLSYRMSSGDFDEVQLLLYFNGEVMGEGGAGVGSGPAGSTHLHQQPIMPLALRVFPQHVLTHSLVVAGYVLTALCAAVVLVYMLALTWYREQRVVRAASYFFLMTLCLGVLMCFVAAIILSLPVSDDTCRAYPIVLGLGYILLIGSLFVKSQRIMAIFTTKKLQVLNLSNLRTGIPLLVLLAMELVFSAIWLGVDPLQRVDQPYVNNDVQTYSHCEGARGMKDGFVIFTVVHKALLGAYGVFLATKTRNVPKAYNESQLIAFSLYNLAFSVLVCFLLLYLTQSNQDLDTPYFVQIWTILWCAMVTCSMLIVPRIYWILYPPRAEFYTAFGGKKGGGGAAGGAGAASTGIPNGGASRKGTASHFHERSPSYARPPSQSQSVMGMGVASSRKHTAMPGGYGEAVEMGSLGTGSMSMRASNGSLAVANRPPGLFPNPAVGRISAQSVAAGVRSPPTPSPATLESPSPVRGPVQGSSTTPPPPPPSETPPLPVHDESNEMVVGASEHGTPRQQQQGGVHARNTSVELADYTAPPLRPSVATPLRLLPFSARSHASPAPPSAVHPPSPSHATPLPPPPAHAFDGDESSGSEDDDGALHLHNVHPHLRQQAHMSPSGAPVGHRAPPESPPTAGEDMISAPARPSPMSLPAQRIARPVALAAPRGSLPPPPPEEHSDDELDAGATFDTESDSDEEDIPSHPPPAYRPSQSHARHPGMQPPPPA